ncbi:hypothetical protein ISO4_01618 [Alcanivorax venustensis ISO4]|uniref:Uncharacterized protein n=1 Tax=Alloalcanivorax venustensis ISO4 TaxID=1177184 RepID=A0ABS0AHN7_9GAMM|nr:hypothetical protein [Alloalcanivorax venustensis]MBF5053016.1 hypothetical protein [Alloalcanivorax venustensis ISO4]
MNTSGQGEGFKIDGTTGATHFIETSMADGRASGSPDSGDYPSFEATRRLAFDPLYDQALAEDFADLLPLAIGIGENDDAPFVIQDAADDLDGAPFGSRGSEGGVAGAPASSKEQNDLEFSDLIAAEIVETDGRTLRLMALSMSGYLVDATIDLSDAQPTVKATWEHVHEGRRGTTQRFVPLP